MKDYESSKEDWPTLSEYTGMANRFGRNPSELCLIFNKVMDTIYETHPHRLESWDLPFLSPDQLRNFALDVHQRCAPLQNCSAFVDGTECTIARQKYNKRVMYNGHKRVHAIQILSIVLPNGLIANLSGIKVNDITVSCCMSQVCCPI